MLEVKNLEKAFGKKKVLKDINFKIDKGDVIGIIGPSGCGKSTLLRCINLLEIPTSGTIIFEGNNINYHHNLESIRKKIGMLFQSFNLFNNMTVIENIILAPTKLGILTKEEAIKKAIEMEHKNDIIVIAGKWHELTQEIKEKKYPFDEREIVKEILEN